MLERPEHSPLGASGASRWMPCPASVGLSYGVNDDEDDEFSGPGQGAHNLADILLNKGGDAWEYVGKGMECDSGTVEVDADMSVAVQQYIDALREWHPEEDRNQGNTWIEREFYCPDIHEYFWGKADFVYVDYDACTLHVWDYKHGAGIVVEVEKNVQCMYYAAGVIEDLGLWDQVDKVVIHIAQPRGFHFDGPIRHWETTADKIAIWVATTLVPAMDRAMTSRETKSGEHCRFCPVRGRACPQHIEDFNELEEILNKLNTLDAKGQAPKMTIKQVGRILDLMVPAMIARKQALKIGTGMSQGGKKVPGWKLAEARSNRKFKKGAEAAMKEEFGDRRLTTPELKSPAQIDAMPKGKAFTKRWAMKPNAGLTLVPDTDKRKAVNKDTKSLFKDVTKKGSK